MGRYEVKTRAGQGSTNGSLAVARSQVSSSGAAESRRDPAQRKAGPWKLHLSFHSISLVARSNG